MSNCRDIQGTLAAALYEPLDEAEQRVLDAHLASCPDCRAEFADLQRMVAAIPAEELIYSGDLLPSVREALRRTPPAAHPWSWRLFLTSFAAVAACFALVYVGVLASRPSDMPEVAITVSDTDQTLDAATALVVADDAMGALSVLQAGMERAETAEDAGRLQLAIANIQFDDLHRYEDAYNSYRRLREEFGGVYSQSESWVKDRYDLLEQARARDYWALYEMDKARGMGELGIGKLEQVMAKYPGRIVAREALDVMVAVVGGQGIEALEAVKDRCSNPIAVAQIDVHLGERYCTDRVNPTLGQQMLNEVAKSDNGEVAKMAKDVLAKLERPTE